MPSMTGAVGSSVSTSAPTLDLDEIQAVVLRPRPAPYFGTRVLFSGRCYGWPRFLRRLAPHIGCRSLVDGGQYLAGGGNHLRGPRILGLPGGSLQSFPEAFPGMAARTQHLRDEGD